MLKRYYFMCFENLNWIEVLIDQSHLFLKYINNAEKEILKKLSVSRIKCIVQNYKLLITCIIVNGIILFWFINQPR